MSCSRLATLRPEEWKDKPLHEVLRQLHEEDPQRPSTRVSTGSTGAAENSGTDADKLVSQFAEISTGSRLKALDRDRDRRYVRPRIWLLICLVI